jgi:hypothetical protein
MGGTREELEALAEAAARIAEEPSAWVEDDDGKRERADRARRIRVLASAEWLLAQTERPEPAPAALPGYVEEAMGELVAAVRAQARSAHTGTDHLQREFLKAAYAALRLSAAVAR